ncbi:MAG: GTPase [Acidilobus sp.]
MDPASVAKRIHVPTYQEILARVKSRYPHNVGTYERERRSLELVRNVIIDRTAPVLRLRDLVRSLHPFYRELVGISFSLEEIEGDFACVEKARSVAERMWERYRYLLMSAEGEAEARRIGREGRGRMMSQLKRCSGALERLKELAKFLSGLPGIDTEEPIVLVSGPPNAGKSTFVSSVSSAKPEVAPYPFTTKNVIVGHVELEGKRVQVVDTPGILDRPLEEMNAVERRAVAALRHLPGSVIFLVDPTDEAFLPLDEQLRLARRVMEVIGPRPFFVAVNKADAVDGGRLKAVIDAVTGGLQAQKVYTMVAKERGSAMGVLKEVLRSTP